jgi:hypothetical protein
MKAGSRHRFRRAQRMQMPPDVRRSGRRSPRPPSDRGIRWRPRRAGAGPATAAQWACLYTELSTLEEPRRHTIEAGHGTVGRGPGQAAGRGKRWRGWYVADDGKQHTQRFRIEVEAEARTTWSKSSNSIFQQCNSESCSFRRSSRASTRNVAARIRRRVDCSPSAGGTKATIESFTSMGPKCHTKPIVGLDVEANPPDMRSSRC